MDAPDADDIRAMIALSRQRRLSFGFCQGRKPQASVMVCHRDRKPEAMGRKARQLGETARLIHGFAETRGRVMILTCLNRPPPRIGLQVKKYLGYHDLKMKVRIASPDGATLEANEDDEAAADPRTNRTGSDWSELRRQVGDLADRRARSDRDNPGRLDAALAIADRRRADGDVVGAERVLRQVIRVFDLQVSGSRGAS